MHADIEIKLLRVAVALVVQVHIANRFVCCHRNVKPCWKAGGQACGREGCVCEGVFEGRGVGVGVVVGVARGMLVDGRKVGRGWREGWGEGWVGVPPHVSISSVGC